MSTGQSDRGNSLTEVPSSQIDYQINIIWNCIITIIGFFIISCHSTIWVGLKCSGRRRNTTKTSWSRGQAPSVKAITGRRAGWYIYGTAFFYRTSPTSSPPSTSFHSNSKVRLKYTGVEKHPECYWSLFPITLHMNHITSENTLRITKLADTWHLTVSILQWHHQKAQWPCQFTEHLASWRESINCECFSIFDEETTAQWYFQVYRVSYDSIVVKGHYDHSNSYKRNP